MRLKLRYGAEGLEIVLKSLKREINYGLTRMTLIVSKDHLASTNLKLTCQIYITPMCILKVNIYFFISSF